MNPTDVAAMITGGAALLCAGISIGIRRGRREAREPFADVPFPEIVHTDKCPGEDIVRSHIRGYGSERVEVACAACGSGWSRDITRYDR